MQAAIAPLAAAAILIAACTPMDDAGDSPAPASNAAPPPAEAGETPPPVADAPGPCDAAKVQDLLGGASDESVRAEAQKRSGASTVRVYRQGDPITMDYRSDRLNIETDQAGKVLAIRCG